MNIFNPLTDMIKALYPDTKVLKMNFVFQLIEKNMN